MATSPVRADPLGDAELYADVKRYDGFGVHRYGSPGAAAALDWIASELAGTGLAVSSQRFTMERQYDFESGTLDADGHRIAVVPQWWLPEQQASFTLSAPIVAAGEARGAFVRLGLPYDRGAYLGDSHRQALEQAFARHPAAVLLTIDHPSGEIFTYNVDQTGKPWPVPVILVAPNDGAVLDAAERAGKPVTVDIKGRYRHAVDGRNVVARLDRGVGKWIVVSTPVTSWFTSSCERGPGIAGFLAMARLAATRLANVDLAFVATSGHEIGHGGMEYYLRDGAPPPGATLAWAHFGSSLACYEWQKQSGSWTVGSAIDTRRRLVNRSSTLEGLTDRHFAEIKGTRLSGDKAAIGELHDVHAAGYANFFGMAGSHTFFHTPVDTAAGTGPDILAPMVRAFADALGEVAARAK